MEMIVPTILLLRNGTLHYKVGIAYLSIAYVPCIASWILTLYFTELLILLETKYTIFEWDHNFIQL